MIKFYQDGFEVLLIGSLILYFLLLVLRISLNFGSNASYERDEFSDTLLEKNLIFVLSKKGSTVTLNLGLILLPMKNDPILEKRDRKRDILVTCSTGYIK